MMLQAADFASFFRAVHGYPPFPWQRRLVEQLDGEDCWPDVLDLPTGAGKTAALDVAVFHLALRANEPWRAALRIVLVVDRRLVVDDAYGRAEKVAAALRDPEPARPVVGEVRQRLLRLAGADASPLEVARLRCGAPLEHDWARTPTQPTILCSTVDQVGSRLLFRGYGVSDRMRPVHAGLLGEDTLILLDKAHLSEPFRQTLDNVRTIGRAQVQTVVLTATPGEQPERPLQLQSEDYQDPILRKRVEAAKQVRLMKPIRSGDPATAFARAAREMAERLRRGGMHAPAVGVVVNRGDLARVVFEKLHETESNCLLMIGRSRDVDRDRIVTSLKPFRTGADRVVAGPLMVVATQCLEVGVDLDLDGLVTQAASLDALRQRFGRLNRAGRDIAAEGAILVTSESLAKRTDDPVYGDRIRKTWDALTGIAGKGHVDFGFRALDQSLRSAELDVDELTAKRARAPVLMPAYLDLWSQTSPMPAADPEVGLFLHGAQRSPAEVSIVWRDDITAADLAVDGGANLAEILELVPPRAAEMVDVPIWAAAAWLSRWGTARAARVADVPEREDEFELVQSATERVAFRWAGADDRRTGRVGHAGLRPGDVLVVPADYGGCDAFGWAPRSRELVGDVADEAARAYRGRRHAVRITPEVEHWDRLAAALAGADDLDLDGLIAAIPATPDDGTPENRPPRRDVREQLQALLKTRGGVSRIAVHRPYGRPDRGVILVAPRGIAGEPCGAQAVTEDDALSRTSGEPVPLDDHTCGVVAFVERFAATLGLAPPLADDLRLAAILHDVGKTDERFQLLLAGGDWWNRPEGPVLAKSGRPTSRAAWRRAGLPKGWRHEALSVQMASADPRFGGAHDPHLVLWLIGTHHGLGRPFFGFFDPRAQGTGPQSLAYDFGGLDWTSLFRNLRQRYGTWGLARLEAILRLADHRASEAGETA